MSIPKNHQMILDMSDYAAAPIGEAIRQAYQDKKFHGKVIVTMKTETGDFDTHVESASLPLLLEFIAVMHHNMPTEPAYIPQAMPDFDVPQTGWLIPENEASSEVPNAAPLDLQNPTQDAEEEFEEDSSEDDETESEEGEPDAPAKADRPDGQKTLRIPSNKGGNFQKTRNAAVTIQG